MQWNVVPEYLSLIITVILLVYSREYNLIPTLKNRLFRFYLYFVMVEIPVSILSILSIVYCRNIPDLLNQVIQMVFFLLSPLLAVFFLLYSLTAILEEDHRINTYIRFSLIPYLLYAAFVVINPFTGWMYHISARAGFAAGPAYVVTYIIFFVYFLGMVSVVLFLSRRIEHNLKLVLLFYPLVSLFVGCVQLIFPNLVMTGFAAASGILIVYLYLQNRQSVLDDLTGLQNRKAFSKMMELGMNRNQDMSVILISLTDFKGINDRYGQVSGDYLLKSIADFLKELQPIRSLYRYSGDEFAICVDQGCGISAELVVHRIQDRFNALWRNGELQILMSAGIAVVRVPEHAQTLEALIALLEYCIDTGKLNRKGSLVMCNSRTVEALRRRSQIVDRMRVALSQNSFEVLYQPIYGVQENRFTTAEALLRLTDKELGRVSPSEFIPLAEENGLIVEMGYMVLERVCAFLHRLDTMGIEIDAISVNLSAIQLNEEGLVERILEMIHRYGVPQGKLRLEVTESVFVDKFEYLKGLMQKLSGHGIRFYLDDFGTGYSNLANVAELPFEFIKIDKSLLYESETSGKCYSVLAGLTRTFSAIGMKVVMEGVETEEQRDMASHIHVDYVQGFLYAQPISADQALRMFGKNASPMWGRS